MKIGLKAKLLAYLLTPLVLIISGNAYFNYSTAKEALNEQIVKSAIYITDDYVEKINARFIEKEKAISQAAEVISLYPMTDEEIFALINKVKAMDEGHPNVFIAYEDKRYFETNGWVPAADYDPTQRPWYQQIIKNDDVSYSDVYKDTGTHRMVLTLGKKIIKDGRLIGVIGMDEEVLHAENLVRQIRAGKTGYGIIIDNKGNYVYHPTLKYYDNIFTVENGRLAEHGRVFLSGIPTLQYIKFDSIENLCTSAPIGKSGWTLIVATPVDEMFEKITYMSYVSIVIGLLTFVLLALIIMYITKRITRPIQELVEIIDKMESGDLSVSTDQLIIKAPQDEVGVLIKGFHNMKGELLRIINTKELERVNEELRKIAVLDGLTGIANRRFFDEALVAEWKYADASNSPLALLMIDIDYFKIYNDTYGHLAGDDCLKSVADYLQGVSRRSTDIVARYGGEEFAIILPGTGAASAFSIGERARAGVENLRIVHNSSPVHPYVTVSVGIAVVTPSPGQDINDLINEADKCLYEAKEQGRNRTIIHDGQFS